MNTKNNLRKIVDLNQILDKMPILGKTVLCHGVFDQIHAGHIDLLKQAKKYGRCLVVSLTDDPFVNKGPDRPYHNIKQRLSVVSALDMVDYVVVSPEESALTVLNTIVPDVYIKGIEYRDKKDITGKIDLETEWVNNAGGKVVFIETDEILSSSSLINDQTLSNELKQCIKYIKTQYTIEDIYQIMDQLKNLDVVLVGETILDEYVFGRAIGKSSKYPCISFKENSRDLYYGGILVVAKQLSSFVRSIKVITCTGDNYCLEKIDNDLPNNILFLPIIKTNTPTIRKTRFIDSYYKSRLFELYDIDDRPLNDEELSILEACLKEYPKFPKIAIDYGHGFLTGDEKLFSVNSQSNSGNQGYNYINKFKSVQHMILDEQEMRLEKRDKFTDIKTLNYEFFMTQFVQSVTTTRGADGCTISNQSNDETISIPALSGKVIDTVGAGDAFFGLYSCLLYNGCDYMLAGFLANIAGYLTANILGHEKHYDALSFKQLLTTLMK
jgi:rfaE bifunctional protein nucleotidyltransferase chain/domain